MKKKLITILFLLGAVTSFAEIEKIHFKITETPNEFNINYIETPDMSLIESKENPDISITRTYKIKKGTEEGELRYSLFTDTGTDDSNAKMQTYIWALTCTKNMAGYDFPSKELTPYGDNDVKGEFNGTYGFNAFIKTPKSTYAEGYNYIYVDFFYKQGQGIVTRAFLIKDFSFIGINDDGSVKPDSALFTNYDSFKFFDSKKDYPIDNN